MEALVAFGVNWKLLLIQGVNFALLLFILHRFLYNPLFALLEKRQRIIAKGLEDAKVATEEKERAENEKGIILGKAREEGGKLIEHLRKEALMQEKSIIREAQEKSAALFSEARIRAAAEREHIVRESEKEVARMAILATEKILSTSKEQVVRSQ